MEEIYELSTPNYRSDSDSLDSGMEEVEDFVAEEVERERDEPSFLGKDFCPGNWDVVSTEKLVMAMAQCYFYNNSYLPTATASSWSNLDPRHSLGKLCGRGKPSFDHMGNRRYRIIVGTHIRQYLEAATKGERSAVVNLIMNQIRHASPLGGFVDRDSNGNWIEIGSAAAREKIGHTIRHYVKGLLQLRTSSTSMEEWDAKVQMAQNRILQSVLTDLRANNKKEPPKDIKKRYWSTKRKGIRNRKQAVRSALLYHQDVTLPLRKQFQFKTKEQLTKDTSVKSLDGNGDCDDDGDDMSIAGDDGYENYFAVNRMLHHNAVSKEGWNDHFAILGIKD